MDFIIDAIVEWLKGLLVDGIMGNLEGLFTNVNTSVGEIDHCSTGAVRRNVPEEKYAFSLQSTWRVSASDHHKLRSSWCGSYKRAEGLQYSGRHCKRFRNSIWFLHFYCADGRNP